MEDEADLILGAAPPAHVSMTPFSPATRRLSSCFVKPSRPVHAARRLAWVSLQGRLVNADEASSATAVNGGFPPAQAMAWELFSPVQRFLIVAVIGVAVAESKKNAQIRRLQQSVQLRDQVLSSMQQKLDGLCDQLIHVKDRSGSESLEQQDHETRFVNFGSCLWDQNHNKFNRTTGNKVTKATGYDSIQAYKPSLVNFAEQEERRMSDLSDWGSSVTSAAEIQMNNLAVEQDIYNLRRDCDKKDATIKELTSLLHSSDLVGSKRLSELEDIIKRKTGTITQLKKDIIVLEQKVMNFTRLQRPSFSSSKPPSVHIPHMRENLVYDMDSTTGPSSSSDSDNSPKDRPHFPVILLQTFERDSTRNQKPMPTQKHSSSASVGKRKEKQRLTSRSASPLKEISMNQKLDTVSIPSSRIRRSSNSSANRRLNLSAQKDSATPHKRWV